MFQISLVPCGYGQSAFILGAFHIDADGFHRVDNHPYASVSSDVETAFVSFESDLVEGICCVKLLISISIKKRGMITGMQLFHHLSHRPPLRDLLKAQA